MVDFQEFSALLSRTTSFEDALALFFAAIQTVGYSSYDYGLGTYKKPDPKSALDLNFLSMSASIDWEARYLTCGYITVDRVTPISLAQVTPHRYADTLWKNQTSALQAQMEDDLHQKGVFSGLSIPVHEVGGRFGIFNLGSSLAPAEFMRLDAETRPLVSLLAHIVHDHVSKRNWPQVACELTERERECLHWAAQGKVAWEIGEILGIAERTVKKHMVSATQRLGATTRTQAVGKAVARGMITL